MGAAVIVATYQDPHGLELCLEGLARQTVMPDEIAIADDGSGEETRTLVNQWQERLPCPVHHLWHPDEGNRKAAISNKAVAATTAKELLFIDGDSIPHSRWVADHLQAASGGEVRCGRRVKLGPTLSPRVDVHMVAEGKLESIVGPVLYSALSGDTKRFFLGMRLPACLTRAIHRRPRRLMGVNFGVSRTAFEAINGYDMEWNFRRQDRDLDLRLGRAGFKFVALLNRAVVYHRFHGETPFSEEVEARIEQERQSRRVRCVVGLDSCDPQSPVIGN
ncbi:MAG TPA: glycosyltransferase [Planctomycetes bacterium]|nr:glycosyltransferase [Planctomycetota bacterium]HIL35974.1 glycosyltransferase [Planctomycetota bacterium]